MSLAFALHVIACRGSGASKDGGLSGADDASVTGGASGGQGGVTSTGGAGAGGATATCGEPGYNCCAGNSCGGGACCVSDICVGQGAICVGLGEGTCSNGSCGTCGGPGQACCSQAGTGVCTATDTKCLNNICSKCGDLGSACCASVGGTAGVCRGANTICSNNLCVACGSPGTPCCPGSACANPACCHNGMCLGEGAACGSTAGTCQAGRCSGCGAATQACCNGSCYDNLLCRNNLCSACGGVGEPCCTAASAANQCTSGLVCSAAADGVCARCGGLGDICCTGGACSNGCCSGGRCLASCSMPDGGSSVDPPKDNCASGGVPCSAIAHFTGTQVVDGKDDEFCAIPSFELNFANAATVNVYNTASSSTKTYGERAVARVAWDAAGLHAFIRVYDGTFTPAASATLWNGDGIDLMFSSSSEVTGLTSDDKNTLHVIASPPSAVSAKDYASGGDQTALAKNQYATGSDTTGYWVEFNLPWPGAVAPTAGTQIKFELLLSSADGPVGPEDIHIRDAQAVLAQSPVSKTTCEGKTIYPFCDDRVWCTTTLQP